MSAYQPHRPEFPKTSPASQVSPSPWKMEKAVEELEPAKPPVVREQLSVPEFEEKGG